MESAFVDFQRLNGTTWFYLSFLLMITVYFRFSRFFSLRNWDLVTLFLFVPGALALSAIDKQLLHENDVPKGPASSEILARSVPRPVLGFQKAVDDADGPLPDAEPDLPPKLRQTLRMMHLAYVWLFAVSGYFFLRCVIDLFLTRRPRLEPNLNNSGLAFLGIALLAFLMYEVMIKEPDPSGLHSAKVLLRVMPVKPAMDTIGNRNAPLADIPQSDLEIGVARSTTIICHLLILTALILIGWQHFESPSAGIGMATLYLLLPVTAINVEKIDHLLPSVFLIWAVYVYRHPRLAGVLLALAGIFYYPLFLLPLWTSFYYGRGARRLLVSFVLVSAILWLLIFWLEPLRAFMEVWTSQVAWRAWDLSQDPQTLGFWTQATQVYRLPIFVVFVVLVVGLAFWPTGKNLAELIALSVALALGVQFWYANRGGSYIHWYLPLLLLLIFRPNLAEIRPPELPVPVRKPA